MNCILLVILLIVAVLNISTTLPSQGKSEETIPQSVEKSQLPQTDPSRQQAPTPAAEELMKAVGKSDATGKDQDEAISSQSEHEMEHKMASQPEAAKIMATIVQQINSTSGETPSKYAVLEAKGREDTSVVETKERSRVEEVTEMVDEATQGTQDPSKDGKSAAVKTNLEFKNMELELTHTTLPPSSEAKLKTTESAETSGLQPDDGKITEPTEITTRSMIQTPSTLIAADESTDGASVVTKTTRSTKLLLAEETTPSPAVLGSSISISPSDEMDEEASEFSTSPVTEQSAESTSTTATLVQDDEQLSSEKQTPEDTAQSPLVTKATEFSSSATTEGQSSLTFTIPPDAVPLHKGNLTDWSPENDTDADAEVDEEHTIFDPCLYIGEVVEDGTGTNFTRDEIYSIIPKLKFLFDYMEKDYSIDFKEFGAMMSNYTEYDSSKNTTMNDMSFKLDQFMTEICQSKENCKDSVGEFKEKVKQSFKAILETEMVHDSYLILLACSSQVTGGLHDSDESYVKE